MMPESNDWSALLPQISLESVAPKAPPGGSVTVQDMVGSLADAGIASAAMRALADTKPVTLVVNDTHRPTDSSSFIKAVFAVLDERVPPAAERKFRLLVASGTHTADEPERRQHERSVLQGFRERFDQVEWNAADDDSRQIEMGGYRFHRWMGEGGLFIACGSTEPHYFAGVTGAHKTLTVGVMGRQSIEANHAHAMSRDAAGLRLYGNPIHEGIVDALSVLRAAGSELLCMNQLVVEGRAAAIWSGDPIAALDAAVPTVRRVFAYRCETAVDVVIASVEPPLDRDLYQADKGIKNCEAAVRDGGILLVDAACHRGVGIMHFLDLLRNAPTHADALRVVAQRGYRLGDHKAVRLRALTDERGVRLAIVSRNLGPDMEAVLGARIFAEASDAARWIAQSTASGPARGLWVRDAGNITLEVV